MELAGVARGGDIGDAAVNDENGGDGAGDTDDPLDKVDNHIVVAETVLIVGTIANITGTADEGDTDSAHDDTGGHDDGKADKGAD